MSLVAAYSDSESEDDDVTNNHDEEDGVSGSAKEQNCGKAQKGKFNHQEEALTGNKSSNKSNFLLSSVGDSGSSESESEEDSSKTKRSQQTKVKLDNPFRALGGATNVSKEDSVFRNPFREIEDQKIAVLEHHVKMTDNPETALKINGKKICWNYRKRKCYLGTQCPFAHDSDVPLTEEQLKEQKVEEELHRSGGSGNPNVAGQKFLSTNTKSHLPGTASVVAGGYDSSAFFSSPHLSGSGGHKTNNSSNNDGDESSDQPHSKSKKRVGLTNSLIPPKKALNLYHKTKDT